MLVSTPTSTSMLKTVLAFHLVLLTMANLHHDDECGDHAVELRRHHYVLTDFADPPFAAICSRWRVGWGEAFRTP
jgi:hypothetical protein